jgi:putative transposase
MVTPKRIWYPGASYHITARGNHRNDIFRDEADFAMYLILIKELLKYYEKYNYELICYCLMTDYVHLLIKANEKVVKNLIRRLHSIYSRYFNKKYNYVGHLWQDKYFADCYEKYYGLK